jgi:hypothetical protein
MVDGGCLTGNKVTWIRVMTFYRCKSST